MNSLSNAPAVSTSPAHAGAPAHGPAPRQARRPLMPMAFLAASGLMAPILAIGAWMMADSHAAAEAVRRGVAEALSAHANLVAAAPLPTLAVTEAARGRDVFLSACASCHGPQGTGVKGLGKDLTTSNFVARLTDTEFRQFIIAGRPDAKPMPMPPRAGREDLSDDDLARVVIFVRGLQDARRMPELPAPAPVAVAGTPNEAQKAAALAAAGGDVELAKYIASGDRLFHSACNACHGKAGVGIAGNGKALANNAFIGSLSDDDLLEFLKKGRAPSDPKNTTGIQMPPKGGNPALSEDDLLDIIAYLRTLQGPANKAAASK